MILKDLLDRARGYSTTTGIDVGHHSIKVVQVQHQGAVPQVIAADFMELPPGVVNDNSIVSVQALGDTMRAVLGRITNEGGLHSDVVVGINWTNGVLADHLRIRCPSNVSEDEAILGQASNRSPFDDPDVMLDYEVMSRAGDPSKEQELEVLVAAAKKSVLSQWAEFYQGTLQIHPAIMDVDAFALVNTLLASVDDEELAGSVAIFNIGHKRAHCSFLRDGAFRFTREIPDGAMEHFVNILCRHLGIQSDKALLALRGGSTEASPETIRDAIEYAADEVALSLDMALQYHQSSENADRVRTIFLTGGGASIPGVAEFLARKFSGQGRQDGGNPPIAIKFLRPLRADSERIKFIGDIFDGAEPSQEIQNIFSVALGLALRKV